MTVVDSEPRRVGVSRSRSLDPRGARCADGVARARLRLTATSRFNVLVLHGEVAGHASPDSSSPTNAALVISRDELSAGRWDYVALGHYHVYTRDRAERVLQRLDRLHEREHVGRDVRGACSAVSKARASSSAISSRVSTHSIRSSRRGRSSISRRSSRAALTAGEVDELIRDGGRRRVPGGIDDKIVRLVVRDIPRHIARELDHEAIREYKRRALNFHLDLRRAGCVRAARVERRTGSASVV